MLTAAIASGALSTAVALTAYPEPYRGWLWLAFILPHSFLRISKGRKQPPAPTKAAEPVTPPARGWAPPLRPGALPLAKPTELNT